ncbi:hypothetical protein CUMW_272310, partial [Citrus unshiu]
IYANISHHLIENNWLGKLNTFSAWDGFLVWNSNVYVCKVCSLNEDGEDDKNFFFFAYTNQSQQLAFYSLEVQQPSP